MTLKNISKIIKQNIIKKNNIIKNNDPINIPKYININDKSILSLILIINDMNKNIFG